MIATDFGEIKAEITEFIAGLCNTVLCFSELINFTIPQVERKVLILRNDTSHGNQ